MMSTNDIQLKPEILVGQTKKHYHVIVKGDFTFMETRISNTANHTLLKIENNQPKTHRT